MDRDGKALKDDGHSGIRNTGQDQGAAGRDGQGPVLDREALERLEVTRAPDAAPDAAPQPEALPAVAESVSNIDFHVDQCLSMVLHHEEVQVMAAIIKRVCRDHPRKP